MGQTYKERFNKKFNQPKDTSNSKSKMVRLTGIPKSVLDDVYDRGVGAYKTNPSSVRPQVKSEEQWAYARIYAFIMKAYDAKKKGKDKINQDQDLYEKIKNKLK
tara:strand:- start:747 stop:1058 length:312 start_codon:yes stop_codon:yes gene_type:complete